MNVREAARRYQEQRRRTWLTEQLAARNPRIEPVAEASRHRLARARDDLDKARHVALNTE
jgi:hypothetical protein